MNSYKVIKQINFKTQSIPVDSVVELLYHGATIKLNANKRALSTLSSGERTKTANVYTNQYILSLIYNNSEFLIRTKVMFKLSVYPDNEILLPDSVYSQLQEFIEQHLTSLRTNNLEQLLQ